MLWLWRLRTWTLRTLDAASLDAAFLDDTFLDVAVLDVAVLDVVNAPYIPDFGRTLDVAYFGCCGFGCCVLWMLRFGTL